MDMWLTSSATLQRSRSIRDKRESLATKPGMNNNLEIEQELECPRCHDTMALCSDFDRLCYLCEECDFLFI